MNFKHLLSVTGLAGLIAAGSSVIKPAQERHRATVERILTTTQPTEENVILSQKYYAERKDLEGISDTEKVSLIMSHARLSVIAEELKKGNLAFNDFLTILKSKDRIITDENTKLKISTNFGESIESLKSYGDVLEVRTEANSPDKILKDYTLSEAVLTGGELKVSFSGTEFVTEARSDKEQLSASTDVTKVGPATYTISVSLVLAK